MGQTNLETQHQQPMQRQIQFEQSNFFAKSEIGPMQSQELASFGSVESKEPAHQVKALIEQATDQQDLQAVE